MTDRTNKLITGDGPIRLPSEALGLPVPADTPRVDYVVTAVDGETIKLGVAPPDARTVLPGEEALAKLREIKALRKPVTVETSLEPALRRGVCIGTPIPSEPPDPSKIVGVARNGPPDSPEEYPPIPPAGFYWARTAGTNSDRWTVVEVTERSGRRYVDCIGWDAGCNVVEWGPRLEPPL